MIRQEIIMSDEGLMRWHAIVSDEVTQRGVVSDKREW